MVELFASNVTLEVVHVNTSGESTVAGYLFVTSGVEADAAQEQRWVLRPGYKPLPHEGTILFRSPPAELSFTTLEGWQNAVMAKGHSGLWKAGSTYVKVASRSFYKLVDSAVNAPAYPTLTLDTRFNTSTLNRKKKNNIGGSGSVQIESRIWRIQSKMSDQWVPMGMVCGSKLSPNVSDSALWNNREWWLTLPGYQPPLSSKTEALVGLEPGGEVLSYDEPFSAAWTEGSTFTIASCSYLDGIPADP